MTRARWDRSLRGVFAREETRSTSGEHPHMRPSAQRAEFVVNGAAILAAIMRSSSRAIGGRLGFHQHPPLAGRRSVRTGGDNRHRFVGAPRGLLHGRCAVGVCDVSSELRRETEEIASGRGGTRRPRGRAASAGRRAWLYHPVALAHVRPRRAIVLPSMACCEVRHCVTLSVVLGGSGDAAGKPPSSVRTPSWPCRNDATFEGLRELSTGPHPAYHDPERPTATLRRVRVSSRENAPVHRLFVACARLARAGTARRHRGSSYCQFSTSGAMRVLGSRISRCHAAE